MRHSTLAAVAALLTLVLPDAPHAAPGDTVHETCPDAGDVGNNVECYPVTFIAKTEIHPDGIPIIGYLFVPINRPVGEPLPAIVFAHGSGSMYSSGKHNEGLNAKHKQWVKQYTNDLGFVSFHVSSFHSRYLLPNTEGDQRILDWEELPDGPVGGDDYRATSFRGNRDNATRIDILFDPNQSDWKDASNGPGGVSEVLERAYDMDAAWDAIVGIRPMAFIQSSRNEDGRPGHATLGTHAAGEGYINEIVSGGLVIDHERVFMYGTSHGGQTAMTAAHAIRALSDGNPMNADLPADFDGRRFAAFFDYYGGCGLHGAYGGIDNSTWRPYAPFLMLHGDHDDEAVFNASQIPVDSPAEFAQTGCGKRISAAKQDPDFNHFLEAIIYKDAYHSFDGVERDDFTDENDIGEGVFSDWAAKIHANYLVTVPVMRAIGHGVAQRRGGVITGLSPAGLGLDAMNPWFHSVSLQPNVPPLAKMPLPTEIVIPDATNTTLDLRDFIDDAYDVYPLECGTDYLGFGYDLAGCTVSFSLTSSQIVSLATTPHRQVFKLFTPRGRAIVTARLLPGSGGNEIVLELRDAIYTVADTSLLSPAISGNTVFDIRGLAWTSADGHHDWLSSYAPFAGSGFTGVDPDDLGRGIHVSGLLSATSATVQFNARTAGGDDRQSFSFDVRDRSDGYAEILCCSDVGTGIVDNVDAPLPVATLPYPNYSTNFVPLDPVKGGVNSPGGPVLYEQHCSGCHGNLQNSTRRNRDVAQIASAIVSEPQMATLNFLTSEELALIAEALGSSSSNRAPSAIAGPDRAVNTSAEVILDGSGSSDPDGDNLVFTWSKVEGPNVNLQNLSGGRARFIAPAVTAETAYLFRLSVSDPSGLSDTDEVRVTVRPAGGGNAPDGEVLYAAHCASCHGALANSERRGRTAAQIAAAIDSVSEMSALQALSDAEIEAVAKALAGNSLPNPGGSGRSGGGGGALFWLLPFMLLAYRHR